MQLDGALLDRSGCSEPVASDCPLLADVLDPTVGPDRALGIQMAADDVGADCAGRDQAEGAHNWLHTPWAVVAVGRTRVTRSGDALGQDGNAAEADSPPRSHHSKPITPSQPAAR